MRRLIAIAAVIAAALVVLVLGTGAGDGTSGYKVRAIFDNAGFLVEGEDVKVSGVVIGSIDSLDITKDKKAVVILDITDPAFQNFKQDARCKVGLQSLLGEKYVACELTQAKTANQEPAPPLRQIQSGDGKGQYLLPLSNTSSRSTSISSTTRCGCRSISAWRSSSTSWAPAWPETGTSCATSSAARIQRWTSSTECSRSLPTRTT